MFALLTVIDWKHVHVKRCGVRLRRAPALTLAKPCFACLQVLLVLRAGCRIEQLLAPLWMKAKSRSV
ncbi:hypothetical protein [Variovorax guangxiensis]|uniref:hypothetical protein n=1 Tax=Variovorax guangxiensis TaxID=1775474 RepID=UPI00285B2A5C|nr:hypothetical protein [Variovorax guangxiensis]MDR6860467.1 hypothetical protein [Variovorax guangxiensis]